MRQIRTLLVLAALGCTVPTSSQVNVNRYAWEAPLVGRPQGADDLIQELREHVEEILAVPHLGPIRVYYADSISESYYQYTEPGRIVTTLAMAWPYLTDSQRVRVRQYVRNECANPTFAPWNPNHLPKDAGNPRARWLYERAYNPDWGNPRPVVHTLYGLWLYAFRSGDVALVRSNWNAIRNAYEQRVGQADLYGTMSAHVAMARMAHMTGDAATRDTAVSRLAAHLQAGLDFTTIENRCWNKQPNWWESPYREMWEPRTDGLVYRGFMFLNLVPELARFLDDHVRTATLNRHAQAEQLFPHWWVTPAPHWSRHTGDEGMGLPSEMHGMIVPVERWVVKASPERMRLFVRGAPVGIGDCYWLEALVMAIEAHAPAPEWRDVRRRFPRIGPSPGVRP